MPLYKQKLVQNSCWRGKNIEVNKEETPTDLNTYTKIIQLLFFFACKHTRTHTQLTNDLSCSRLYVGDKTEEKIDKNRKKDPTRMHTQY